MARLGRPKKSKTRNKLLAVRVTGIERQTFEKAADLAGIALSAWARERLRLAAIRDLEAAGYQIPLLEPRAEERG